MEYKVKLASTKLEIENIINLRFEILRKPWQQPIDTATDNLEDTALNAYIENEHNQIIACGRLHENENGVGQIRFMAVSNNYQGKGLGKLVVAFLEAEAKELKLKTIQLQARENAVDFYKANGYTIKEKTFLLWGIIQHYLMEKEM